MEIQKNVRFATLLSIFLLTISSCSNIPPNDNRYGIQTPIKVTTNNDAPGTSTFHTKETPKLADQNGGAASSGKASDNNKTQLEQPTKPEKQNSSVTSSVGEHPDNKIDGDNKTPQKQPFGIITLIFVVAFFVLIPMVLDIVLAHGKLAKIIDKLQNNELAKNIGSLTFIPGLARSMIAFTVILIIGIVVFVLLTNNSQDGLISNTLTALTTTLTSITAYYFGSRAMEKSQDKGKDEKKLPEPTTGGHKDVTTNSAILNGTVNPHGLSTTVYFQYGTATGKYQYNSTVKTVGESVAVPVAIKVYDLTPNTDYYYRIVAQCDAQIIFGTENNFKTDRQ